MPREITSHKVNPINDRIKISVLDEPGSGGACHVYDIEMDDGRDNLVVQFQNGGLQENGVNGVTQEVLLAICIDRLQSFQMGEFACRENAIALTKLEEAQLWLHARTRERLGRGVEGKTVA